MRQVSLDLQAAPSLRVQEKTVLLNRTEAAFVDAFGKVVGEPEFVI